MLHPDTCLKFISDGVGYGVFATRKIPAGTITYIKDALDIELAADDELTMLPAYADHIKKYAYREPTGSHVIGWDLSKYMNHSCDPNSLSTGYGFEIAVRDIAEGEQITDDYGMLNIDSMMACLCQSDACRSSINPDDLDVMWREWDSRVITALSSLLNVEQPLIALLDSDTYRDMMHYLNTGANYRSVKLLRHQPVNQPIEAEVR